MSLTVDISNKRHYYIQGQPTPTYLPSVTTIIGSMSDKSGLDKWRKEIGEENAKSITQFSVNRGTVMHSYIENYLSYENIDKNQLSESLKTTYNSVKDLYSDKEISVGRKLFYNFYLNNTFNKIKKVILQEEMLWSLVGGGYAGRTDCIYKDHNDLYVISDYKTSKKPKEERHIESYKIQISAYYVAYWQLYGIKPDRCEIWISNEQDALPQIFTISRAEIKKWYMIFIDMVKRYHLQYNHEVQEYIQKINNK